jgi:hypothetical protein
LKAADWAGVRRARRAAEWGKNKYAGSWAEYLAVGWIALGAAVGLMWRDRGLSWAAAVRKLRRAS